MKNRNLISEINSAPLGGTPFKGPFVEQRYFSGTTNNFVWEDKFSGNINDIVDFTVRYGSYFDDAYDKWIQDGLFVDTDGDLYYFRVPLRHDDGLSM